MNLVLRLVYIQNFDEDELMIKYNLYVFYLHIAVFWYLILPSTSPKIKHTTTMNQLCTLNKYFNYTSTIFKIEGEQN